MLNRICNAMRLMRPATFTASLAASLIGVTAMATMTGWGQVAKANGAERASEAGSGHRQPVEDLRVVLVQAIDAPDGQAHAVLVGASADAITAKFKATSPIFVDVSTLKRYSQEGCRRLRLALWQDGVLLPGALGTNGPQRRSVAFDLNYCRDGSPPASLS